MARKTGLQKAVGKALSKLRKTVNDLTKKGFIVPEYVDRMLNGKSISTRRLQTIESYDRNKLINVSKFWDSSSQRAVTGARGAEILRETAARKSVATRRRNKAEREGGAVVSHYMHAIQALPMSRYFRVNKKWVSRDVSDYNDAIEEALISTLTDATKDGEYSTYVQYLNRNIETFDSLIESLYALYSDDDAYSEAVNKIVGLITSNSISDSDREDMVSHYTTGDDYDI